MRYWRARSIAVRYPSSAPAKSAGPSALTRGEDLGLGRVGVDLARRRGPRGVLVGELLPAQFEDGVGVESVERAMRDQGVVALPPDRPRLGAGRDGPLDPARRTARSPPWRWPPRARVDAGRSRAGSSPRRPRSRRRRTAGRRRSRVRCAASAGPAGPRPASSRSRDSRRPASSRPVIAVRRSASGAWSRENSRNRPSPTASRASERRSQMRSSSVSKMSRRTLWSSRSRSNRALAERPSGSIASTAARCALSAARSSSTDSRPPSPSWSSWSWRPSQVAMIGSRATIRRKRVSTRSKNRVSSGPGVDGTGRGRGASSRRRGVVTAFLVSTPVRAPAVDRSGDGPCWAGSVRLSRRPPHRRVVDRSPRARPEQR